MRILASGSLSGDFLLHFLGKSGKMKIDTTSITAWFVSLKQRQDYPSFYAGWTLRGLNI
jgi:hypothetical protein